MEKQMLMPGFVTEKKEEAYQEEMQQL